MPELKDAFSNLVINYPWILVGAFDVIGLIEYVKALVTAIKNPDKSNLPYVILSPVACVIVALAADGGVYQVAFNALTLLATTQLCYQVVLQGVTNILKGLVGKFNPAAAAAVQADQKATEGK
jgi:hypothetical protein